MESNLIVPCAGQSTRFPGMRPKWMLAHPNGEFMVTVSLELIEPDFDNIYIVILKEHVEKYNCLSGLLKSMDNNYTSGVNIIVLDEPTNSQPETVAKAIEKENIKGSIFIKDADSYFDSYLITENAVCTYDLHKMQMTHPANKSYVSVNDKGNITNIVEKRVISPDFCVGGYSFESADEYMKYYNKLKDNKNLYVSHIIFAMLLDGKTFKQNKVNVYEDWGTLESWNRYKETFKTLFIDLDGTLVYSSAPYSPPYWGETKAIKENVEYLRELYDTKRVKIIITTARTSEWMKETLLQLDREGIPYDDILFDLPHGKRTIINDYAKTNSYPSCEAINLERDTPNLREMLK